MEPLQLKQRLPAKDDIECWDDDEDLQGLDDLQFRHASIPSNPRSHAQRDSTSSRVSLKSELDEDGDFQLNLPTNDDLSAHLAIADAKRKGIELPKNVPASALIGGAIRRLGGKRSKKELVDDWSEDLEMPDADSLQLKPSDPSAFPESLANAELASPVRLKFSSSSAHFTGAKSAAQLALERFRDTGDDPRDATVKPKQRPPLQIPLPAPAPKPRQVERENYDDDLELPADGELRLSTRRDVPQTPVSQTADEFEVDWADGSQASAGHSGKGRTGRSNRSSSVSALSPSVFSPSLSSLTAESEDEGLDGLVLPDGPISFQEKLEKRMRSASPEPPKVEKRPAPAEDFFSGIDIGDGEVFDSGKLTLNRNIKRRNVRQPSPKRSAVTLTFTNKPNTSITRIPKPSDRPRSKLETVPESTGPSYTAQRVASRTSGHSAQSSVSSIPTPTPASQTTPSRRLATRTSREAMKTDANTLLKAKRSMPILGTKSQTSPSREIPRYPRPNSRTGAYRTGIPARAKTPTETVPQRSHPAPFIPAGGANRVAHKSSRTFHRPTSSDSSKDMHGRPSSRNSSNQSRAYTPTARRDIAPESLVRAAASKRTLTRPTSRRVYGDGNELDAFDDLPTSSAAEARFLKPATVKPTAAAGTKRLYSHSNQSGTSVARTETPSIRGPPSPEKSIDSSHLPSFARSTTASLARKQRTVAMSPQTLRHPPGVDKAGLSANWKLGERSMPATAGASSSSSSRHPPKKKARTQQKPHLIKRLGNSSAPTQLNVKGMQYNPELYRWEGNEQALAPFDVPASPMLAFQQPAPAAATPSSATGSAAKPALIANVGGAVKGVQVVGGMVFDPQRMCWLKMAPQVGAGGRARAGGSSTAGMSLTTEDEEEDPFAGMEDLVDNNVPRVGAGGATDPAAMDLGSDDDNNFPVVGEEFDVGPEFVKRQRNEEAKWVKRLSGWKGVFGKGYDEDGRWAIWQMVAGAK